MRAKTNNQFIHDSYDQKPTASARLTAPTPGLGGAAGTPGRGGITGLAAGTGFELLLLLARVPGLLGTVGLAGMTGALRAAGTGVSDEGETTRAAGTGRGPGTGLLLLV